MDRINLKGVKSKSETETVSMDNSVISIRDFSIVFSILILVWLTVRFFHIEDTLKLGSLLNVILPGFLIYAFLPIRFRLPFLFLLNVVLMTLLFGPLQAMAITGLSLLFIGIGELPIQWSIKAMFAGLFTIGLVLLRVDAFGWTGTVNIAKIVGVLVMFRGILYYYEMRHEKQGVEVWKRINYFFLLPNLIFFIFPIVDYKTFTRNYYDRSGVENYRKGLQFIFTGLVHFMVYRILYYYFVPSLSELNNIYSLLQYMLVSYALIVRLSGLFHFSAGVICLFGFNLPETFSNYFLAESFSDLWRRINIYWKDFVMKVFYFPIYFAFKKRNNYTVFITVLIVFFFNWFLHAYQWFWIKGQFLLKANDILFWALLGFFVAINSVYQKNTKRAKKGSDFKISDALLSTTRIYGMYFIMSFLWVFWTSPNINAWIELLTKVDRVQMGDILRIGLWLLGLLCIGMAIQYVVFRAKKKRYFSTKLNQPSMYIVGFGLFFLVLIGNPVVRNQMEKATGWDMEPILFGKLNKADQEQLFEGYYDELIKDNNFNSRMWEAEVEKPEGWGKLKSTGLLIEHDGLLSKGLKPNQEIIFKNKPFSTNEFGLRDLDYALEKPVNCLRMALLGGSMEIGSGVADDETFENVLERKLNESKSYKGIDKIEIINFCYFWYPHATTCPNY